MKKNVLMRAASGLLVATMLTTCAISGTFAKYVTQDNGGDNARVAKWGVVVQVEGDLYSQRYYNAKDNGSSVIPGNVAADQTVTDTTIGVNGKQTPAGNVVAPGTKSNENFSFNINGTPEVDSKLTVTITHQNVYLKGGEYGVMVPVPAGTLNSENFDEIIAPGDHYSGLFTENGGTYAKVTGNSYDPSETYYTLEDYVNNEYTNYYPVVYSLKNSDGEYVYPYVETSDNSVDTLGAITDAIFTQITKEQTGVAVGEIEKVNDGYADKYVWSGTAKSGIIENNNDLSKLFILSDAKLAWEWNFEDSLLTEDTYGISQEDKLDTILGNLMAQRVTDTGYEGGKDFNGVVVKLSDKASGSWKAPNEAAAGVANDFCLDTQFNIDILVEQVD